MICSDCQRLSNIVSSARMQTLYLAFNGLSIVNSSLSFAFWVAGRIHMSCQFTRLACAATGRYMKCNRGARARCILRIWTKRRKKYLRLKRRGTHREIFPSNWTPPSIRCTLRCLQQTVLTVGTMPAGWNGISDEVFISIPCVVGKQGISHVVSMKLSDAETERMQRSARILRSAINRIIL